MLKRVSLWATAAVLALAAADLHAHQDDSVVSRMLLVFPDLGHEGGAVLHGKVGDLVEQLADNVDSRYKEFTAVANSTTVEIPHNLGAAFDEYRILLFTGSGTNLVRVEDPAASGWTIAADGTFPKTVIDITTPGSGGPHTFAIQVVLGKGAELLDDLEDVDLGTPPEDGQALVYDDAAGEWVPGASGDASFKVQDVTDPNASIKGGYLLLDDGRELATYDGAGTASTDFGVDLTVNLDTVLGSNPADATTYYLYIDLDALDSSPTTLSDNGRQLYPVVAADLLLSTTAPASINRSRYVPRGFVRSATSGTVWSGAGAAFGSLAFLNHDNGPLAVSPVFYRLSKQVVGSVGSSGQVRGGHILATSSFPSAQSSTARRFYNLSDDANDDSGNGTNLTNNGTAVWTTTSITGVSNDAATLDGTDDYFSSTNAFFNPGNGKSWAMGGWFKATDWTPSSIDFLISQDQSTSDRGFNVFVNTDGSLNFQGTNTAGSYDLSFGTPPMGFTDGTWHHIAATYDFATKTVRLYADGAQVGSGYLANTRSVTSALFTVGAWRNAATSFFAGSVQEVFFVADATMTAEDIRRLAATKVSHGQNVAPEKQRWSATAFSATAATDAGAFVVDKLANEAFLDFSTLAATDSVEAVMESQAVTAVVVPASPPFDQTYTSNPSFPISHGLADVPRILALKEVSTGVWAPFDPEGHLTVSSTQINGSLAAIFTGGATKVRIIAYVGTAPTGVYEVSATRAGIMGTGPNDIAGLKTWTGRQVFQPANGVNYVMQIAPQTAATPYGLWITEPSSAGTGYPLLNITNSAATTEYARVDSVTGKTRLSGSPITGGTFTGTTPGVLTVRGDAYTANDVVALDFNASDQVGPLGRVAVEMTGSGAKMKLGTSNSFGSGITNTGFVLRPDGTATVGGFTTVSAQTVAGSDCTGSPCTLDVNHGGGISSITRGGTGDYTINFTASFWSTAPACTFSAQRGGSQFCEANISAMSTTSLRISCWTHAGVQSDTRFSVICHGPRAD